MTEPVFPEEFPEETSIQFFSEEIDFDYANPELTREWIQQVISRENGQLAGALNYIFCSDDYLYRINLEYLAHDTLTDIITFPYTEPPLVSGDIFVSIERVRENARQFGVAFERELHRVMIHGVLHLCGQGDKTAEEKQEMRVKEDEALQLLDG